MNELSKKRTVFFYAMPCILVSSYISEKPVASVNVGGGRRSWFLLNCQNIGLHCGIQSFSYM
jgi:hypothetical protein